MRKSVRNVSFSLYPGDFRDLEGWFSLLRRLGVGPKNLEQVAVVKFDVCLRVSQKGGVLYAGHIRVV